MLAGLTIVAIYSVSITWCGPWDPWETHYGEVARNIVRRRDPLDLWWRPGYGPDGNDENVFYSKHALPFWAEALSFRIFNVGTSNELGEMVQGPLPEIALRLPSMVVGLTTLGFLGFVVGRLVSKRAGILAVVVLGTMPQFAIVSRQALTDMFFVGPVCLAMGAWAMAWLDGDRELRTKGRGLYRIAWDKAWLVFFIAFLIAVVAPLAVLHHHVIADYTIERVSRFKKRKGIPNLDTLRQIHFTFLYYWGLVVAAFLVTLKWKRRSQAWMGLVYLAGGLSMMGKGLIGPGIIGLLILSHMLVTGRLRLVFRCGLLLGTVLFVLSCFPWHHAMWIYRGERWANELIVVNNLARFASGEQKQAVGDFAFYVQTLGLAAFPWVAAVPIALWQAAKAFRARASEMTPALEMTRLALLWFVVTFALISYSVTKYYHYLLPCLPPLGVVVAIWLDRLRPAQAKQLAGSRARRLAIALCGCLILVVTVRAAIHEPAWIAHLTTYLYTGMWREGAPVPTRLAYVAIPFGVGLLCWAWAKGDKLLNVARGLVLASGLLTATYVIDDYLPAASESWSQRSAFRYYYEHREKNDRIASWWFYYRGETYFSKGKIWVLMKPDRQKLGEFIEKHRDEGITFWFMTTVQHEKRLSSNLPRDLADRAETVYANFHYALIRVPTD